MFGLLIVVSSSFLISLVCLFVNIYVSKDLLFYDFTCPCQELMPSYGNPIPADYISEVSKKYNFYTAYTISI